MSVKKLSAWILACLLTAVLSAAGEGQPAVAVKVLKGPAHAGRITPFLYGNFIEILDDVIPGMWAEMLGDRGFEGILPTAKWVYHQGALNLNDRDWDRNPSWAYDPDNAWNGKRSARITASKRAPGSLSQRAIALKKGMTYLFSGYFRSDTRSLEMTVSLKALLPDGTWMTMGREKLEGPGLLWNKQSCRIVSSGATDRAVFEIEVKGEGRVWTDKLSLMPADNIDGWRRDVVAAVREMRPPILRWGGSTVDPGGYQWKNGIGDRDLRAPFENMNWGRLDSNDVGVEEFVRFCRAVDAEPLICVSFGDGPENAGRMVEYLNGSPDTEWGKKRAANGHLEPYGVKYWQVGNEVDDTETINRCRDFCLVIRKADPGAVIFSSFPSKELMKKVGDLISYFCPHYYTADLPWVERDIRNLKAMIAETVGGRDVGLAVTEWNINAGNWGLGRGKLYTLGCALFEAQFLNLLQRNSDIVKMACRSNLTNSFCGGTIQTNAGGLFRIPAFYVMKLYRDHSKPVPLRTLQESPEGLDISACAAEDGKTLCVFIVNSRKEPVSLSLDLEDFGRGFVPGSGEVICDTQDRSQIDIINFWDHPDRIKTLPLSVVGSKIVLPALSVSVIECGK